MARVPRLHRHMSDTHNAIMNRVLTQRHSRDNKLSRLQMMFWMDHVVAEAATQAAARKEDTAVLKQAYFTFPRLQV